jgi:hypothetical protein
MDQDNMDNEDNNDDVDMERVGVDDEPPLEGYQR